MITQGQAMRDTNSAHEGLKQANSLLKKSARQIRRDLLREVLASKNGQKMLEYCYNRALSKEQERMFFDLAAFSTCISNMSEEYARCQLGLAMHWTKRLIKISVYPNNIK